MAITIARERSNFWLDGMTHKIANQYKIIIMKKKEKLPHI
jgi:hypothetical protein